MFPTAQESETSYRESPKGFIAHLGEISFGLRSDSEYQQLQQDHRLQ